MVRSQTFSSFTTVLADLSTKQGEREIGGENRAEERKKNKGGEEAGKESCIIYLPLKTNQLSILRDMQ